MSAALRQLYYEDSAELKLRYLCEKQLRFRYENIRFLQTIPTKFFFFIIIKYPCLILTIFSTEGAQRNVKQGFSR